MFVHKEGFIDAKNRGVYLRYLTEITKDMDGIKAIW